MRGDPGEISDSKAVAKIGMKAANACATSLYAGITAAVIMWIPFVSQATVIGVIVAFSAGIRGLILLGRYKFAARGMEKPTRGLELVAARRVKKAPDMATSGIGIALILIAWSIFWRGGFR